MDTIMEVAIPKMMKKNTTTTEANIRKCRMLTRIKMRQMLVSIPEEINDNSNLQSDEKEINKVGSKLDNLVQWSFFLSFS